MKTRTPKLTPAIKRHGGKYYLAPWILNHAPKEFTHYAEPYFGAGAVLMQMPDGKSQAVNDIDKNLMNLWRVLQLPTLFAALHARCIKTPFSEPLFKAQLEILNTERIDTVPSDIQMLRFAFAFFVVARQSRQGLGKDFATLSRSRTRGGRNEQASAWLGAIDGLDAVHDRLKGVVLYDRPALEFIRQQDSAHTWFYLDPPYMHETRTATKAYEHEMSSIDHSAMLELLTQIKGKFMLSGYSNPLYNSVAVQRGWRKLKTLRNNAASGAKVKPEMIECLWMNYGEDE